MVKISIKWFFIIVSLFFIVKCAKIDPVTGEKVIIEPNVSKRQQAYMDKEGGIFGDFNKKNQGNLKFMTICFYQLCAVFLVLLFREILLYS